MKSPIVDLQDSWSKADPSYRPSVKSGLMYRAKTSQQKCSRLFIIPLLIFGNFFHNLNMMKFCGNCDSLHPSSGKCPTCMNAIPPHSGQWDT